MTQVMSRLRTDRRGITALEYGLLVGIIMIALLASFGGFATTVGGLFTTTQSVMLTAMGG